MGSDQDRRKELAVDSCHGGRILLDGVPKEELTRENVHELFGMVLQDTWLFEGTIRENVVYSKEGVTDEQVEAACKAVGIHHFIHTLPEGYGHSAQ